MSSHQPIITVEHHFSTSPNGGNNRGSSSSNDHQRRRSSGGNGGSTAATKKVEQGSNGRSHSPKRSRSPLIKSDSQSGNNGGGGGHNSRSAHSSGGGAGHGQQRQHLLGESGVLGASLCVAPNTHVRRKSSPCIGALPPNFGQGSVAAQAISGAKSGSASPSRGHGNVKGGHHRQHVKVNPHLKLDLSANDGERYQYNRRRLSSPPSFDPGQCSDFSGGGSGEYGSGGSNHSSGHGSMQQLAIGGLNASRWDSKRNLHVYIYITYIFWESFHFLHTTYYIFATFFHSLLRRRKRGGALDKKSSTRSGAPSFSLFSSSISSQLLEFLLLSDDATFPPPVKGATVAVVGKGKRQENEKGREAQGRCLNREKPDQTY